MSKLLKELKKQLEEKDVEINKLKTILSMQAVQVSEEQKLNLISTNCIQYNPNQTAITELNSILDTFAIFVNEEKESMVSPDKDGNLSLLEYIENRINTLKGDSKC